MIEREGDIGSSENRDFLRLIRQEDGDIIMQSIELEEDSFRINQVEFCTIGIGGGKSPETFRALTELFEAIKKDNLESKKVQEKPKTWDKVSTIKQTQKRQGDMAEFERKNFLRVHVLEDNGIVVEVAQPNDNIYQGSSSVGFCSPDAGGNSPSVYNSLNRLFETMGRENKMEEKLGSSS